MNELFKELTAAGVKGLPESNIHNPKWTFGNSVLFSITLLTTVGYGHLTPLTNAGKIWIIVYTSVGISVTLYTLSLYVMHLMGLSALYKVYLFRKLKGPMSTEHINVLYFTTLMTMIVFGCFFIPAAIFQFLEDSWSYLDALYYCFISLTTVGLGDFVPGSKTQSQYIELYRIGVGFFILYGVTIMMFMLAMFSDFIKNFHEEATLPVPEQAHKDKSTINIQQVPNYGTVVLMPEEQQRLLQP